MQNESPAAKLTVEVPVQLAGGGTWKDTSASQDGGRSQLILSPQAPDPAAAEHEARHTAQLSVLLNGKPTKALSAASSPKAAAAGLGLLGASTFSTPSSSTKPHLTASSGGTEAAQAAAVLKRLSLANLGLLSAPDAASLPWGPSRDATAPAGSSGVLGWDAAEVGAFSSTAGKQATTRHAGKHQKVPALQYDISGSGSWFGQRSQQCQSITVGTTGPPAMCWQQDYPHGSNPDTVTAASVRPSSANRSPYKASKQHISTYFASTAAAGSSSSRPGTAAGAGSGSSRPVTAAAAVDAPAAPQKGTAAFKGPSRDAAGRAGRVQTPAHVVDQPGPGQFRPLHSVLDKHVPGVAIGRPASRGAATGSRMRAAAAAGGAGAGGLHQQQDSRQQRRSLPGDAGTAAVTATAVDQHRASTGYRLSEAVTEGAGLRRSSMCTVGTTPRSADDDLAQQQGKEQQKQQQRPCGGTAAFKAVSRDQAAAVAASRPCGAAPQGLLAAYDSSSSSGGDQRQGQEAGGGQEHVRPASRGLDWSKQTWRPPPSAPTSSPAALGPGAYFRSGALPASLTGRSLLAGHHPVAAAVDFGAACSRPGSRGAGGLPGGCCLADAAASGCCPHAGNAGQLADEPGLWGWAADDRAVVGSSQRCSSAHTQHGDRVCGQPGLQELQLQQQRPCSGVSRTRPGSAALDYARGQHKTVLVAPSAEGEDDSWLMGHQAQEQPHSTHVGDSSAMRQPQQRPSTVPAGTHRAAAAAAAAAGARGSQHMRPGTAGSVLLPGGQQRQRPASCKARPSHRPGSSKRSSSPLLQHQQQQTRGATAPGGGQDGGAPGPRGIHSSGTDGLGVQELQRFSSTGFAARVKGGRFPDCGREGSVAAAAASEMLYEPKPEVQGHMHRSPGWSLPPNRVETSRKWAQLAAQAALQ